MELSRRDFLEGSLGAVSVLGISLLERPWAEGAEATTVAEIPVVWLATGACSGCSVSLLNTVSPTIQEVLLNEVLPGSHLSLKFHSTLMAASGQPAIAALAETIGDHDGHYVLVVEGATSTKDDGLYCAIGEDEGKPISGYTQIAKAGQHALAALAVGSCASFGGIPAAGSNPTACVSVSELFAREKIATPYVNIPGCPPHPDWIVGTIATLLLGGVQALDLDDRHRPAPYFSACIHDNCSYRGHFERGDFAEHYGQHGCLLKLGCKGPITLADCPVRKFNNGTSWCCEAGHPCIGCCHPDFPFATSLFAPVEPSQLDFPAMYPTANEPRRPNTSTYVAVGLLGAGGFLAGTGVATAARMLNSKKPEPGSVAERTDQKEHRDGDH